MASRFLEGVPLLYFDRKKRSEAMFGDPWTGRGSASQASGNTRSTDRFQHFAKESLISQAKSIQLDCRIAPAIYNPTFETMQM